MFFGDLPNDVSDTTITLFVNSNKGCYVAAWFAISNLPDVNDLKDSHYAQYMHTRNTLELCRAVMLQLQLPGTSRMTRHAIHTIFVNFECKWSLF